MVALDAEAGAAIWRRDDEGCAVELRRDVSDVRVRLQKQDR